MPKILELLESKLDRIERYFLHVQNEGTSWLESKLDRIESIAGSIHTNDVHELESKLDRIESGYICGVHTTGQYVRIKT